MQLCGVPAKTRAWGTGGTPSDNLTGRVPAAFHGSVSWRSYRGDRIHTAKLWSARTARCSCVHGALVE